MLYDGAIMARSFFQAIAASLVLALGALVQQTSDAEACDQRISQQTKVTKESLLARRDALIKARDALRTLASQKKPAGLSAADAKAYGVLVASANEMADDCDATATKINEALKAANAKLDGMAEMTESQQLRMQMAMDRMSKATQTASNLLKKFSDTAGQIVGNMK